MKKRDASMSSEAQQWANELESLGRHALYQCERCRDGFLQWSPPSPDLSSLCTLATELAQEIEWWVLVQIGERRLPENQVSRYPLESTFSDLSTCYEEWIREVHILLDPLPDAFLDLYVDSRFGASTRKTEAETSTVRNCLFKALERCAVLLGHIEVIQHMVPQYRTIPQEVLA